jgi:hypothetical protein
LDEFKSQASQSSSKFFPISFNPCIMGITEQGLNQPLAFLVAVGEVLDLAMAVATISNSRDSDGIS